MKYQDYYEVPCTYCNNICAKVTGREIYPHRKDLYNHKFYRCLDCNAYVGTHVESGAPLGTPANKELRGLRNNAHLHFDELWQWREGGRKYFQTRKHAYTWLAHHLKLPLEKTHIGMFNEDECRRVVKLCIAFAKESREVEDADSMVHLCSDDWNWK